MEETVATIFTVVVLTATTFFVMYLIGALGCALAGADVGFFGRLGVGVLGLLTISFVAAQYGIENPPPGLLWFGAVLSGAGLVVLLRRARATAEGR